MKLIRLNKNSFIRQFETIGYIYNQLSRMDLIVDGIGAVFLNSINRNPTLFNHIINELCVKFPDATRNELNSDFTNFANELSQSGFVILGNNIEELNDKDVSFSFANKHQYTEQNDKEIEDTKDYLDKHFGIYPRIFRAHIELTNSCNLKCIHCYLSQDYKKNKISKEFLFSFLDQLEKMGTLEVIFTGGEALLYEDLNQVLRYAREKDFSIVLLTNGTLFNEEIIKTLKDINIAFVQVSLYSMVSTIHDKITGIKGSWQKTKRNIERLVENDIRVEIACPIIKENADSFHQVIDFCNNIGVSVSNDLGIMAGEDFSRNNLDHRVEISEIKNIIELRSQHELHRRTSDSLYHKCTPHDSVCGMGKSLICLSYDGNYYPCPGFRMSLGGISEPLDEIWKNSPNINFLRKITYSSFPTCMNCKNLNYCTICPAKFYNESGGDVFKIDNYFCEINKAEKEIYT